MVCYRGAFLDAEVHPLFAAEALLLAADAHPLPATEVPFFAAGKPLTKSRS